jgi:hypothetical protein
LVHGWYLLRKNHIVANRVYRAGTLVEYLRGEWFLRDAREDGTKLDLDPASVCRTFYQGVSLYEIECTERGAIYAKPVLSDTPFSKVDPRVVHVPIKSGDCRVCIKYGCCFLPLEFFNW